MTKTKLVNWRDFLDEVIDEFDDSWIESHVTVIVNQVCRDISLKFTDINEQDFGALTQ